MSTGTFIIESGYKLIGVHSVVKPASPEDIEDGKNRLNAMLQALQTKGILLGIVPLQEVGDELGEPMDATNAIIDNFALQSAPNFDNGKQIVSPELRINARSGMALLNSHFRETCLPVKKLSTTTVRGSGHRRYGRYRVNGIFMGNDNEVGS